ncbi:MAG: carbohydrate kinase [Abditibacteriota bacterium]|nr:carbohydrate kinase [Abditibacteriota bacterium]
MKILGGLDIGTGSCKISLYDSEGRFLLAEACEYEVSRRAGDHELDPETVWQGVKEVISRAASRYDIDAIGVTSLGESFVALDASDRILLPAMMYTDPRGAEEYRYLEQFPLYDTVGTKPHSMYSLPKLMWIKKHKPDIYKKIKRVLLFEDYIVYRLTGCAQIDYSLAARTMGFDIRNKCWSREAFLAADVDPALFSRPVPTGSVAGASSLCGLKNAAIVSGSHDQVTAALGSGSICAGAASDGMGSVECITPVFSEAPREKAFYDKGYSVVPYAIDGLYACYVLAFTCGTAVKWFRNTFAPDKAYAELSGSVGDEPSGIVCIPHFGGAATPYMDETAKAAFYGVTLETTREQLYRSILEGANYEMLLNLEVMKGFGVEPEYLTATGGGAKSPEWLQIKADILNKKVVSVDVEEAGATGTLMLAGAAIGAFDSLEAARDILIKPKAEYLPRQAMHERYMETYELYKKLSQAKAGL